jgi:serine/threonine protein phosphatase PrpC
MIGPRTYRVAGATDVGSQREANEDRFYVDAERGVFIVADGIGGHAAGETAAETAIAAMRERLSRQTGALTDRMREAITIANNEVHRAASTRPEWQGMACVLTAAIVNGTNAVIGHVGDSRLYRLQGDRIEKITPDHSPVGEREDARELSEAEAMQHPRRNEVYRDVGSEPREISDPDFVFVTEIPMPADAALLICSDGLTDLVPSETIRQIVAARAGAPDDVVRGLIAAANEAGGKDNITVVFVEGPEFGRRPSSGVVAPLSHVFAGPERSGLRTHTGRNWMLAAAIAATALAGLAVGANWDLVTSKADETVSAIGLSGGVFVVRTGESIQSKIDKAGAGSTIIVERGEYREQLKLKSNVRVISRVPRGATIRLPSSAAERDAAVAATDIVNAELTGFRIVGDAATPLGVGVFARDSTLRLMDIEVSGATATALDLGSSELEIGSGGGIAVSGSDIHDNSGSALIARTGASLRLTHNTFEKNAFSERPPAAVLVERDAKVEWQRNVFYGMSPEAIAGTNAGLRAALIQANVFIGTRPATTARPPAGRGGREQ